MHLDRLILRNFKKFRRADMEFSDGLTGIVGSNGAGKSTIVEAIAWALYGNRASAIKREFIRNSRARESDAVEVDLYISLGRQELVIHRGMRGRGLMPEAYLKLDGQMISVGSREVDGRLEEILKISYQDFMKTFYARQKDLDNLLKEGATGKREYLLKLLGLEEIKESALDLIKADKAALEEEKNRLEGALAEIGDIQSLLQHSAQEIQAAKDVLESAERTRTAYAAAEEERRRELEALGEKMRRHERLAEKSADLEAAKIDLAEKAALEESRLQAIDHSQMRLQEIRPSLERLAAVKERLDLLEPKRTSFEATARKIASLRAALQAEKRALAESGKRLQDLMKDAAERESLLAKEQQFGQLQERSGSLERSRDRCQHLQFEQRQMQSRAQSAQADMDRARKLQEGLRQDRARLAEIGRCREEEAACREELSHLLRQREMKKERDELLARASSLEERLACRRKEQEMAREEKEALGDIEAREELVLRQDRDLEELNSELSRLLADMRGNYKVAESSLAEAERSLQRALSLGEEAVCPTCERPLQGQKTLLMNKYEQTAAIAREEKKRLDAEIARHKEKIEGAVRSRSNLKAAFDLINSQKSRRAALQASLSSLDHNIDDLQAERKEIESRISDLGEVEFDPAGLEGLEARLAALQLLVQEHAALSLRLEEMPRLEREIADRETELAGFKESQKQIEFQLEALGFQEADFLEAKEQALSLQAVHDRFLALTERIAEIPSLQERCRDRELEASGLERSLRQLSESERALGYDPAEYESLLKEKRDLAVVERERQQIAVLIAGEAEARERLAAMLAAQEKLKGDLEECHSQIDSLSYRKEEHEKARIELAAAGEELDKAERCLSGMRVQMGVLLAERERLVRAGERREDLEKRAADSARRAEVVDVTRLLVNSFMDQVLIRVKSDIARTAGEILEEVSGRYSLIKIDEEFNIQVEDGGTFYPISRYSGGEIDMIAVSVRVAISEYLMRFGPDGGSYSFLILDEVFGSQDQEHREKMIQMLRSLEERFPQIIAISHISDVQGQFDNALLVAEDEMGNSRVEALN